MKQRLMPVLATAGLLSTALLTGCGAESGVDPGGQSPTGYPGSTATAVADPVFVIYMGTQTIELGAPPAEATHIYVELTCLSAGTLLFEDGFEVICGDPNESTTRTFASYDLPAEQAAFEVTTDPDVSYEVRAVHENGASVQ
ncbi:MAG: hypothetical protein ACQEXN_03850 [Actinomycetota bacterium]